jgi:2'-5' RNA ligase
MIFPHFKNERLIDDIREKYDPLAEHVRPHITLVFPFDSDIETTKLKEHIVNVASNIKTFSITLSGITPSISIGNYLFLNIKEGNTQINEIHKRLYKGILKEVYPEWLNDTGFLPHMTVGNY